MHSVYRFSTFYGNVEADLYHRSFFIWCKLLEDCEDCVEKSWRNYSGRLIFFYRETCYFLLVFLLVFLLLRESGREKRKREEKKNSVFRDRKSDGPSCYKIYKISKESLAYDRRVITLVFASHGRLAEALLQTIEGIAGRQPHVEAFGLLPGVEPVEFAARLDAFVRRCNEGAVLVLCDLRFGTPYNIAMRMAAQCANVEVLSGLNLPMGLEAALGVQDEPDVHRLAQRVRDAALRDLGHG